jgi:hypothetical protein
MEEENISIKSLSLPFYTLGLTQMYVHGKAILFFLRNTGKQYITEAFMPVVESSPSRYLQLACSP